MTPRTIKCAFCHGTGENPHFRGTCPVCKGKRKNQVTGRYMACGDCRGSGQKGGTTLTCYTCAGLGIIPDTRPELRQARQEIRKIQAEMAAERTQLSGRQPQVGRIPGLADEDAEADPAMTAKSQAIRFCQSCAKSTKYSDVVKVCLKCFRKIRGAVG